MASGMVTIPFRRMASVVRCGRRRCPVSAMPPWYHAGVLSSCPTFVSAPDWLADVVASCEVTGEFLGAEDCDDRPSRVRYESPRTVITSDGTGSRYGATHNAPG